MRSVATLLNQIIDYAGLFPPAQLEMREALNNFIHYQQQPESWMLARFICPLSRLEELALLWHELAPSSSQPLAVSVWLAPHQEFLSGLQHDIEQLASWQRKFPTCQVESIEYKIPPSLTASQLESDLHLLRTHCIRYFPHGLCCYGEISFEPKEHLPIIETLSRLPKEGHCSMGVKIRMGGADKTFFPSTSRVLAVLQACRDYQVSLKATAGLHHPIHHYSPEFTTYVHGFVNVFTTAALLFHHKISPQHAKELLEEKQPGQFHFSNEGFFWRDKSLLNRELAQARQHFLVSFGSCSFEEPKQDLQELRLI